MGTKPAPLNIGDRMWLRARQDLPGGYGRGCWVVAIQPASQLPINVHLDDGSGRTRDIQLADPAGTRRWVARGQLVAFGTATWFRESRRAAADARAAADKAARLADPRAAALAAEAALQMAMARSAALDAGAPALTPARMAVVAFQNSLDGIN